MTHVLYTVSDGFNTRVICERPDWKNCPEHKHLSDKMPEDFLTQNEEVFESINNDIDSAALAGEEAVMRAQNEQYESLKKSERRKKIITAAAWTASVGGVAAAFATGLFVFALPIIAMAGWKTQSYLESKK